MFYGGWIQRALIHLAWNRPAAAQWITGFIPFRRLRFQFDYLVYYWKAVKDSGLSRDELKRLFGVRITVLCYHDLAEKTQTRFDVRIQDFQKQMQYLRGKSYCPISIEDFLNWMDQGKPLPAKPVLITFDDGYKSFVLKASQILKSLNFPATVFVCPVFVGKHNEWDSERGEAKKELMDWDDLQNISQSFHVGSHGMSHRKLKSARDDDLEYEVRASYSDLISKIREPLGFCYPYGEFDSNTIECVENTGYCSAFTTEPGWNTVETGRHTLRRLVIESSSVPFRFRLQLILGRDLWADLRSTFNNFRRGRTNEP